MNAAARRPRSHHYSVYVVELADRVWNVAGFRRANPDYRLGKPFVYVGMTGLDPDLRFDRHMAGIQANRFVASTACACCRRCTRSTTRCRTTPRARWRSSSASALREAGYGVWQA